MENYLSKDLYLSAFLKTRGLKLIDTLREGRTVFFIFQDSPARKDLMSEYFDSENVQNVNVGYFIKAIQDLKTLIFETGGRDEYGYGKRKDSPF